MPDWIVLTAVVILIAWAAWFALGLFSVALDFFIELVEAVVLAAIPEESHGEALVGALALLAACVLIVALRLFHVA